jgi:hypothetical protein
MPKSIILKHDSTENWKKAINFIPKSGEVIIYDDMDPPFKIGDGIHTVNELPFVGNLAWSNFTDAIQNIEESEE